MRTLNATDYTPQRIKNREESLHHDTRCPSCKSRKGSRVTRTFPTISGRIRERLCLNCAFSFQTTEVWPQPEEKR